MKRSKPFLVLFLLIGVFMLFMSLQSEDKDPYEDTIEILNDQIERLGMNWKAGVTSMTELSLEETRRRCGTLWPLYEDPEHFVPTEIRTGIPASFRWDDKGGKNFCPPVDDQAQCGSCWAFGSNSAIEATYNVEKNRHVPASQMMIGFSLEAGVLQPNFSEEFLVSDCCIPCGDCAGGFAHQACEKWRTTGVPPETCDPYTASDGPCTPCANWGTLVSWITGWSWVTTTSFNHAAVKQQLYDHAPLIATMDVYNPSFNNYVGGIYEGPMPGDTYAGGHCIMVVGYDNANNCYVCQNSWGTSWGESGYFRIKYGSCDIGKWILKVWGVKTSNKPPVLAAIGPQNGKEGQELVIQLSAADPDNDPLSYSYQSSTLTGAESFDTTAGEFKWTPGYTDDGVYWVTFKVTDGFVDDYELVKITIANVKKGKGKF